MDNYWMKNKDNTVAAKKLDKNMDAYWAKKGEAKEGEGKADAVKDDTAATEE